MKRSLGGEVHDAVRSSRKTAIISLSLGPAGSPERVCSIFILIPFHPNPYFKLWLWAHMLSVAPSSQLLCLHFLEYLLRSAPTSLEHKGSRGSGRGRPLWSTGSTGTVTLAGKSGEHCKGSWWPVTSVPPWHTVCYLDYFLIFWCYT